MGFKTSVKYKVYEKIHIQYMKKKKNYINLMAHLYNQN